jgi:hypothetical protein
MDEQQPATPIEETPAVTVTIVAALGTGMVAVVADRGATATTRIEITAGSR